jgi:hypothetical protein
VRDRHWLLLLVVVACGRELGPAPSADDAGTKPDAGTADLEPQLRTFPCGSKECTFGTHACCFSTSDAVCEELTKGCAGNGGSDAGADATPPGPPLLCATYRNCPSDEGCCFSPDAGSKCQEESCGSTDTVRLCTLNQDSCGDEADCESFPESPTPSTTGRCVKGD